MQKYRRIASLKTIANFRAYIANLGIDLPLDEERITGPDAPLAQPYFLPDGFVIGNRFCIQPMEGWDGTPDGRPTDLTYRRWIHFGQSGAKLIWGGEATAVRPDGRANPNQLLINPTNLSDLVNLRQALVEAHEARFGRSDDLLVGLQLTHSGRFARPNRKDKSEPVILYHHPLLDRKFGIPEDYPILSDAEIERLIEQFVDAAELAHQAGFAFVDIKHCHGYLGHEFLSAYTRPGPYGAGTSSKDNFENRTRFLRQVVEGIRSRVPTLRIGVRVSAFDFPPFRSGDNGFGIEETAPRPYRYAFGVDFDNPLCYQLEEMIRLLQLLESLDVRLVNITAGSPYYNPHIQRPALFPPSDGYQPPEDPLVGVARQIEVTTRLKEKFPNLAIVGSAYSYLQEWLPHVAQHNVRVGRVDFVGLGRMILAYPDLPADVLAGRPLDRLHICRTFSDCTTAPRNGMISGCYPLDPFYKARPEASALKTVKASGSLLI
jgi:2,4-dienoyl-CoA reductase-like NADH-dependent reductase (Old Yellow Enzyme family)